MTNVMIAAMKYYVVVAFHCCTPRVPGQQWHPISNSSPYSLFPIF